MENKKSAVAIIVVAIAILAAIVIFAKPGENTSQNNEETGQDQVTSEGDAGKIGKNEIEITAANFEEKVAKAAAGQLVVVDVYAPWCPHCQKMGPVFSAVADQYAGRVVFGKMNANNQDDATKETFEYAINLGLQGYPTFWFYKDGKKVAEQSGELSESEFKEQIENYIK